jgi:hypothetical protein
MDDVVHLGGNIQLEGFRHLDGGSMVILKKIVGTYARKFSDGFPEFKGLSLSLNKQEDVFELTGNVALGERQVASQIADKNLFFALDRVLKDLEKGVNS